MVLSSVMPVVTGAPLGLVAASVGGDSFVNTGAEFVVVRNGGGVSVTVTAAAPNTCSFGLTGHTAVVSVAAGAEMVIGPFKVVRFNDASGYVQLSYSSVASVTIALVKP